jgi:hypothetical protein
LTAWLLKMRLIDCHKMLVRNYHSVLYKIPKEYRSQPQTSIS